MDGDPLVSLLPSLPYEIFSPRTRAGTHLTTYTALNPSGAYIAVGTFDGSLLIYSSFDFQLQRAYKVFGVESVVSIVWLPDSQSIVAIGAYLSAVWLAVAEFNDSLTYTHSDDCVVSASLARSCKQSELLFSYTSDRNKAEGALLALLQSTFHEDKATAHIYDHYSSDLTNGYNPGPRRVLISCTPFEFVVDASMLATHVQARTERREILFSQVRLVVFVAISEYHMPLILCLDRYNYSAHFPYSSSILTCLRMSLGNAALSIFRKSTMDVMPVIGRVLLLNFQRFFVILGHLSGGIRLLSIVPPNQGDYSVSQSTDADHAFPRYKALRSMYTEKSSSILLRMTGSTTLSAPGQVFSEPEAPSSNIFTALTQFLCYCTHKGICSPADVESSSLSYEKVVISSPSKTQGTTLLTINLSFTSVLELYRFADLLLSCAYLQSSDITKELYNIYKQSSAPLSQYSGYFATLRSAESAVVYLLSGEQLPTGSYTSADYVTKLKGALSRPRHKLQTVLNTFDWNLLTNYMRGSPSDAYFVVTELYSFKLLDGSTSITKAQDGSVSNCETASVPPTKTSSRVRTLEKRYKSNHKSCPDASPNEETFPDMSGCFYDPQDQTSQGLAMYMEDLQILSIYAPSDFSSVTIITPHKINTYSMTSLHRREFTKNFVLLNTDIAEIENVEFKTRFGLPTRETVMASAAVCPTFADPPTCDKECKDTCYKRAQVVFWATQPIEDFSAQCPGFTTIASNVLYIEREDEYDLDPDTRLYDPSFPPRAIDFSGNSGRSCKELPCEEEAVDITSGACNIREDSSTPYVFWGSSFTLHKIFG